MKKKNVINLIKYHLENNNYLFRLEALEIAKYFDKSGDYELSEYIMSLLSDVNDFVPQSLDKKSSYFKKVSLDNGSLILPEKISNDIKGIMNAVGHNVGVNKFLFEGAPGTGKTEAAKQIAKILNRQLYIIEFSELVDSKMGETPKNIVKVFNEINAAPYPSKVIILLDEIDIIALDRINSSDVREMGRTTSTLLRELDKLNNEITLIATTNLFLNFDKALTRRFDSIINFNRYKKEDLIEIAEGILNNYLKIFSNARRNMKLFKKIIKLMNSIPFPGDLTNIIKSSLAFSNIDDEYDYLKILFNDIVEKNGWNIDNIFLKERGFTLREIEILTNVSKSKIGRELKEVKGE